MTMTTTSSASTRSRRRALPSPASSPATAATTTSGYATNLRVFAAWCGEANVPLFGIRRAHLERIDEVGSALENSWRPDSLQSPDETGRQDANDGGPPPVHTGDPRSGIAGPSRHLHRGNVPRRRPSVSP